MCLGERITHVRGSFGLSEPLARHDVHQSSDEGSAADVVQAAVGRDEITPG